MVADDERAMTAGTARRAWARLEAIHVLAYFAPPVLAAQAALGLGDRLTGYVASRSAPMGAVGPELVTSSFYGFSPRAVATALPAAWEVASPAEVLAATDEALIGVLDGLFGDVPELNRAAELAREASLLHPTLGRPLAAAWSGVDWAEEPSLVLWQASSRIRESRGDGHLALLVTHELDGVEAHLTTRGDTPKLRQVLGATRGLTDAEWDAAADRLRDRGILDAEGALTDEGRQLRERIEERTDALTVPAWSAFGTARTEALIGALDPLVERVLEAGILPGVVARLVAD